MKEIKIKKKYFYLIYLDIDKIERNENKRINIFYLI